LERYTVSLTQPSGFRFAVRLGLGDGTFLPNAVTSPILMFVDLSRVSTEEMQRMAAVDVNGDGRLDIVGDVLAPDGKSFLGYQYAGRGDGTFGPAYTKYNPPVGGTGFGDFNRDGRIDFAYHDLAVGGLRVRVNNGSGDYTNVSTSVTSVVNWLRQILPTDYDGDGITDLIIAGRYENSSSFGRVSGWRGNGSGTFSLGFYYSPDSWAPQLTVTGDFDGDSIGDTAVVTTNVPELDVRLLRPSAGTFTFARFSYHVATIIADMQAADLNGDLRDDLVISSDAKLTILLAAPADLAPQSITFQGLSVPLRLSDGTFAPSISVSSGLTITLVSSTPSVCTVNILTVSLVAKGTCTLTASQPGNATTQPATPVSQSYTVLPLEQTITIASIPSVLPLNTPPFPVQATASSGLPVSIAVTPGGGCSVEGDVLTLLAEGRCELALSQAGNQIYGSATLFRSVFVNPASSAKVPQTITFGALSNRALGAPTFTVSAIASSGLPVSFSSNTLPVCTVSGTIVTQLSAGTCSLTASQAGNATYDAAFPETRTFAVVSGSLERSQTIDFGAPISRVLQDFQVTISANSSSSLPVTFTSGSPSICTVVANTVTLLAVGNCSITASQAGDITYAPAPPVTRTFPITNPILLQPQTIAFPALPARTLGAAPFVITASASSGLPVKFSSNTTAVCTVGGSTITLHNTGQCSITASQAGNSIYLAATPVTQTFLVSPAPVQQIGPNVTAIQEAAGYAAGKIAPSSFAVVRGDNFLPAPIVKLRDSQGIERVLDQLYAGDSQINIVIPAGIPLGSATIIVSNSSGAAEFPVTVAAIAPGVFTANSTGSGPAAANVITVKDGQSTATLVADGPISRPPGSEIFLVLYGTGIRGHAPNGVTARIGNLQAEVQYAGPQGSYPALDQINLKVPPGVAFGTADIQLTVDGVSTNIVTATFQ
jgi:uncharacterized protein (TIGR03437 family)